MAILSKSILLTGLPIYFNNPLKIIYQPKLIDIYKSGLTLSKLSRPYLLFTTNKKVLNSDNRPLLFFFDLCRKVTEQNKYLHIDVEFIQSLSLFYKTNAKNIHTIRTLNSVAIRILDPAENEIGLITDDNVYELVDVVLGVLNIELKDTTMHGDKEVIDKFERERKKYAMKKRMKELAKLEAKEVEGFDDERTELPFYDKINYIIHQQENIDYDKVFELTVWQMINTYTTLMYKSSTDRYVDSGSVQWKPDGFVNWIDKIKFKIKN